MWLSDIESELRAQAEGLNLFDASAWLGRTEHFPLMSEGTPSLLQSVQERSYIREALVSWWPEGRGASQESNRALLDAVRGHPGWYATLTVQPLFPADPGSPATPEWVWPAAVRAVRVFPATFQFELVEWCVGSLCELLLERRLPFFVLHTETAWRHVHDLAKRYPDLKIVVESQPKKILYHMRMLLPLMQACPNVHVEISNFCSLGLINYTVNTLGPDRLLFGTFAPANDPLVPLGLLLHADISQEARAAIAGGNIRRILSEVEL